MVNELKQPFEKFEPIVQPDKRVESFEGRSLEQESIPESAFSSTTKKLEPKEPVASVQAVPTPVVSAAPQKTERLQDIEGILSADLDFIYKSMPPEVQAEFKKQGEQTAHEIDSMVSKGKVRAKKIVRLIVRWLRIIPGINKFFLEQEAKIKTDNILHKYTDTI